MMNEQRIKELWKQAVYDKNNKDSDAMVQGFAELIVKECAKVAQDAHGVTIGQGYNVSQQIKKHFGVE